SDCYKRKGAKLTVLDVVNAIVPSQSFVDKCVTRVQDIENAAILVKDRFEQQLGFTAEGLPQVLVKVAGVRFCSLELFKVQPLAREIRNQGFGLRIGQHPSDLPFKFRRIQ